MAAIPADIQKQIMDRFSKQQATELGQLRAEQQKSTNLVNQQKAQTVQDYYDKRNQADVTSFQGRKALQEMMAASGLARSGENISGQVGLNAARQNVLGGLNREEQGIMNSYNQRINEINDPSQAQRIISAIESQRSAALAEALERAIARQHEIDMFNRQQAAINSRRSSGGRSSSSRSSGSASQSTLAQRYEQYQKSKAQGMPTAEDRYYEQMAKKYPDQQRVANDPILGEGLRKLMTIPPYPKLYDIANGYSGYNNSQVRTRSGSRLMR